MIKVITYAVTSWKDADKATYAKEPDSFLTVAKVATHGIYKRQNTMRQYAFNELKPIDCNCSAKICIPTSELALTTLNKIAIEETTTSLATIPAISASTICQKPSPNGANNGLRACPTTAPKLSDMVNVKPFDPKCSKAQTARVITKIVVPALLK